MDLMIHDIEVLRTHLGIDQWNIMGHSFGGMMAYYYASKHPETIIGMIQSSSGAMDLRLLSTLDITESFTDMQRDSLAFLYPEN
ncbi:MAG: alpha/beta fold hydrolase [Fodinibius sp.]|nr:alpha/beta fold hydrolase [Fodinibius sp.]